MHFPEIKRIEENAKLIPNEKQRKSYVTLEKQKLIKKIGFDIEQIEKDLIAFTEGRKSKDFFLWNVYFAEVFSQKNGFDIVIGNPPYIQLQKAINDKQNYADLYKDQGYKTFERTGDIYALFYERGLQITAPKGLLTYITSNKWMRAKYGKSLRKFLSAYNPKILIDLGPGVFTNATVDTNILLIEKSHPKKHRLKALTLTGQKPLDQLTESDFTILTHLGEDSWIILSPQEQQLKEKIERIGTPLKDWDISINYGIKTGYNEAFIIDGPTKDRLIARDPKSAEIIKPILRGRDIKRYKAEFADLWLINTHNGYRKSNGERIPPIDINDYPAIKEHLDQYWEKLVKRQDKGVTPYNLRNCAYMEEFEKEKIVWGSVSETYYTFVERSVFLLDTNYFCVFKKEKINKYILSLLNSKLIIKYINEKDTLVGTIAYRHYKYNFEQIPIPKIPQAQQEPFIALVDQIIAGKEAGTDTTALERRIDLMVYKLYELTYNEVKIIDPAFEMKREAYETFSLK